MSRRLRMSLVLFLTASIAGSAVLAAPLSGSLPRQSAVTVPSPMSLVAQAWSFLSQLWFKNGSEADPNGAWAKNGSDVDPNGRPLPPPGSTPTGDNGAEVDPNGLH